MKDSGKPMVSVIVPVYNAFATLPVCLNSLVAQTYKNLELLFVDDGSTDESLSLLYGFAERFATEERKIKVLCHNGNRGVAAARNTGLQHAEGDYIYSVDADDSLAPDALASMVLDASVNNADIVGIEWYLSFQSNKRYMTQPVCFTPLDVVQKMMSGVMRWNLWLFLVKRSLYTDNHIQFIEGMNMGEDMMVMIKLLMCASNISMLHKPFYYYHRYGNDNSLTKIYSAEHIAQVMVNVHEIEAYLKNVSGFNNVQRYIHFLKLNIKLPLLMTDEERCYRQWLDWFPESNMFVMSNRQLPLRVRMVQWLAVHRLFFLLKLYYWTVFKVVYGLIYR